MMFKNQTTRLMICVGMFSFPPICTAASGLNISYFPVEGHQAFILKPAKAGANTPWVWYAPTFAGAYPDTPTDWLFQKLLDKGIAIAGIDVGESYGSPVGRALYNQFYDYATTTGDLALKPVLLGQSRGGLMMYNWAAENASEVSAIAGIYPVGDLRSYPGLRTAAPAYGMTEQELQDHLSENNPIDRLTPLAQAGVPLFSVHGDSDIIVPLDKNSQVVYDRYTALGGQMQLIVVPGKGHQVAPAFFQSPQLLDFMITHAIAPEPGAGMLFGAAILCGLLAYAWRRWR